MVVLCPAPAEMRLDRHNPGRHLTFLVGPRNCPGQGLSRLEQNIATSVLINRLDDLRITPGKNDMAHQPGIMLGLYELHLSFTKR